MKTPASSNHSQLTAFVLNLTISLSFASLAEAQSAPVRVTGPTPGPVRVRVIAPVNEGPAPERVTVTPPPISKQRAIELQNARRARKMAEIAIMEQEKRNNEARAAQGLLDSTGEASRSQSAQHETLPRAEVVGQAGLRVDSASLAANRFTLRHQPVELNGLSYNVVTMTVTDLRTEATRGSFTLSHEKGSGRLESFATSVTDRSGQETAIENEVDFEGRNLDIPVVTQTVIFYGSDGSETGRTPAARRSYDPEIDPPLTWRDAGAISDPGPGKVFILRANSADIPLFHGPMGIVYNPLTGQWSAGTKQGNTQAMPGCEGALPKTRPAR